jgi:two-component system OmpR family response regulator
MLATNHRFRTPSVADQPIDATLGARAHDWRDGLSVIMSERILHMANEAPAILVVDDDREIRTLLSQALDAHGYRVRVAADVGEMDRALAEQPTDLVLLDIMMPGEDGLSACQRITRDGGPAVIFLSGLGEERDRIVGLEAGAGHYLPKPCSAREVISTVRAALRSRNLAEPAERRRFLFSGWQMDIGVHELIDSAGVLVGLTDGEFALLRAFVERPRRILSRDMLLEAARGPDSEAFDRAIDVQISRLRRKLRAPGDEIIRTIRNEGYLFVPTVVRA